MGLPLLLSMVRVHACTSLHEIIFYGTFEVPEVVAIESQQSARQNVTQLEGVHVLCSDPPTIGDSILTIYDPAGGLCKAAEKEGAIQERLLPPR